MVDLRLLQQDYSKFVVTTNKTWTIVVVTTFMNTFRAGIKT